MYRLGWLEIVVVLLVILLLFGARRVPDLARSLGRALNEFKKGQAEGNKETHKTDNKDQHMS